MPLIQETRLVPRAKPFGTLVRFLAVNLTGGGVTSGFALALREPAWNSTRAARQPDPPSDPFHQVSHRGFAGRFGTVSGNRDGMTE
jgi:hypothetical protein